MVSQSCRPTAVFSDFRPLLRMMILFLRMMWGPTANISLPVMCRGCIRSVIGNASHPPCLGGLSKYDYTVRYCPDQEMTTSYLQLSSAQPKDGDEGQKVQLEGVIRWEFGFFGYYVEGEYLQLDSDWLFTGSWIAGGHSRRAFSAMHVGRTH